MTPPASPNGLELKICGTTSPDDAAMLNGTAVDYCGVLVDVGFSPRSVTLERARAIRDATATRLVVLLCNPSAALCDQVERHLHPFAIQFLCAETPEELRAWRGGIRGEIWKSVHLPWLSDQASPQAYVDAGVDRLLFDSQSVQGHAVRYGGTGQVADWSMVQQQIERFPAVRCFLAGGLEAANVQAAVARTRPQGVDLCSGVESRPGKRDPGKLAQLLAAWDSIKPRGEVPS